MDAQQLKRYIRLIYTKAFRYLGAVLVLCALIGGIYGNIKLPSKPIINENGRISISTFVEFLFSLI